MCAIFICIFFIQIITMNEINKSWIRERERDIESKDNLLQISYKKKRKDNSEC